MATGEAPQATVVITTKNRKDELRTAIASALRQDVPVEVLVIDDGSTDGTSEMVRSEFPAARLVREDVSRGYIVQRNRGAALAAAPIIFSIDDDAAFPSPATVRQTLAEFDHPRVGAVAIPVINIRRDPRELFRSPAPRVHAVSAYMGTSHALRRDLFLSLGAYRETLFHQGEELDYCARLLDAGYIVRAGTADPIHHFESPNRDQRRVAEFGRRNEVLFGWHNVPTRSLPAHLLRTVASGLWFGLRSGRVARDARGLARGLASVIGPERRGRRPISPAAYRLLRRLQKRALPLEDIEPSLPRVLI